MYFHILCPLFMLPNWVLYPSNLAPFNLLRHLSHLITVCFYSGEIKSRSNIWHHNSCLLDKKTSKICKKFHFHDGLLRADQGRTKNIISISCIYTLYNAILRIARNFLETRENIKISTHPYYHINLGWFSWEWSKKKYFFSKKKFKMADSKKAHFSKSPILKIF